MHRGPTIVNTVSSRLPCATSRHPCRLLPALQVRNQQKAHWDRRLAIDTERENERAKVAEEMREKERLLAAKLLELQGVPRDGFFGTLSQLDRAKVARMHQLHGSPHYPRHTASHATVTTASPRRPSSVPKPYTAYDDELRRDVNRIGFAFGGVNPGRLHAHGKLVEEHKVIDALLLGRHFLAAYHSLT
jgi:hypothetical protein